MAGKEMEGYQSSKRDIYIKVFGIPVVRKHIDYYADKRTSENITDNSRAAPASFGDETKGFEEVHTTMVFGISVMKKYITGYSPGKNRSMGRHHPDEASEKCTNTIVLVSLIMLLAMTIFHVVFRSGPVDVQPEQLQNSLEQCESNKKTVSVELKNCTEDKTKLNDSLKSCSQEKAAAESRIVSLEGTLQEAENKTKAMENYVKVLQSSVDDLKVEKQVITKKYEDTKFELGECRNKNMDHEISNSELLVEVDELKQELKKC